ncbi:hypothetical protein NQ318_006634 [Aromia moschata]|uniref:G-protein coupled receptors family 1 profile domain-containing protein n=1 Tax=Aromia moschata TaxID=1265417 RepID=A0AAV8XF18_9CUCU|nr:hypothetical protein NQ318_006634 [Aromia moschata]
MLLLGDFTYIHIFFTVIISICWFAGSVVGFLPVMGWHSDTAKDESCFFLNVMDLNYLVFLYFGTIITPALMLAAFYTHIYQVVLKQASTKYDSSMARVKEKYSEKRKQQKKKNLRQIVTMNPEKGSSTAGCTSGGTMIRMLGVQQTNEVKATQNLAIIVLFFMICWIPLYTINCILAFRPDFQVNSTFMLCCIILSHLNSAGNPLLYAYHLRDFRSALKNFFCSLFDHGTYCEQINRGNYGPYRQQLRKKSTSSSYNLANAKTYKLNPLAANRMASAMHNPVSVATAAVNQGQRDLWNVIENSVSSSDSVKSADSCNQDKVLMIRPATPYRPRNVSEVNPAYMIATRDEESDDGFNEEETLPYHDFIMEEREIETCLSERVKRCNNVLSSRRKQNGGRKRRSLSTSSPQLSKGLFFVENYMENDKAVSFNIVYEPKRFIGVGLSENCSRKTSSVSLSPFRAVNDVSGSKRGAEPQLKRRRQGFGEKFCS